MSLTLRPATNEDAAMLWAWRNDPETRAQSHSPEPVPWESHRHWLAKALLNPDLKLFIAVDNGIPIGTGRLDLTPEGGAVVSITVAPNRRGRGYAIPLMQAVIASTPIRPIFAHVKIDNPRSCRMCERAGFQEISRDDQFVTYRVIEPSYVADDVDPAPI